MKRIDFVFFDAGGGHRAAATALKALAEEEGRPWQIRLVNLQEVLDSLDVFRRLTGIRLQDIYNRILKNGWTLGSAYLLRGMHQVVRLYHGSQVRLLAQFWAGNPPDLVVSLIPNFGRAVYHGLRAAAPGTPLVTILTDMADYPPHFWIERGQDQYFVCGTPKAVEQARALGYSPDRVIGVSGMILHPRFYRAAALDRAAERRKLGLEAERPTGLILFGGQGSPVMRQILERIERAELNTQFIAICGRNLELRKELQARCWRMPVFVEGFTAEVPYYMAVSDFFIGKPGPGSISEAVAMGLPVLVERNAWTLPQERYNTDWVEENQVGMVMRNFREIAPAVARLVEAGRLEALKANVGRIRNRAVFEIMPVIERLLESAAGPVAEPSESGGRATLRPEMPRAQES